MSYTRSPSFNNFCLSICKGVRDLKSKVYHVTINILSYTRNPRKYIKLNTKTFQGLQKSLKEERSNIHVSEALTKLKMS